MIGAKTMKLIFLRHAHSAFNRDMIYQGQYDCELSEKGIEDLRKLKQNFNKNYDYCYCSPLKRTRYTAETVVDKANIKYDDRLKEIGLGVWENTPITEEKNEIYKNGFVPEGGETQEELDKRVKSFLEDLRKIHKKNDTILIVTHGWLLRSVQRIIRIEVKRLENLETLEVQIDK